MNIRVAAFTGGLDIPSARFRVRQHVSSLRHMGIEVRELFPRSGKYPPRRAWMRPPWLISTAMERIPQVALSYRADMSLLQREMISTLATFERFVKSPRILDVDDAIFLKRGGAATRSIARKCQVIICGNDYLANWFSEFDAKIFVIPTSVDTEHYRPDVRLQTDGVVRLLWIGTSGNLPFLQDLEQPLRKVMRARRNVVLKVVCDRRPMMPSLDPARLEYEEWTREGEVAAFQSADIGLMPLSDTPWARGKCSFKMLQYMACGLPAVSSAVGMNVEVGNRGGAYVARSDEEWVSCLLSLVDSSELRISMGIAARQNVIDNYSARRVSQQLAAVFRSLR